MRQRFVGLGLTDLLVQDQSTDVGIREALTAANSAQPTALGPADADAGMPPEDAVQVAAPARESGL
ncbi:hypothetical protein NLM24_04805 [Nocardia zapadnayensis]|nr:hypothetical protein [Nocardia zapadnayensis]MCX0270039.1 hypothetical protein [Nocardia zapadnayensis]